MSKRKATNNGASDEAVRIERSLLQCVIERPALIGGIEFALADALLLSDHRKLWRALVALHSEGVHPDDDALLAAESGVDLAVIGDLHCCGAVSTSFERYVRHILEAYRERRFVRLREELGTCAREDRLRILEQIQELSQDASDWRGIFHTVEEFKNAAPLKFAIEGLLQAAGITFIGGLSGHGKTLFMLAMAKALLDGKALFEYFAVPQPSERVVYLIPECTISPFKARIKLFHLEQHIRNDQLLVRTLSSKQDVPLTDARLLRAVRGADVFLDTAVRFMEGGEDVESSRKFAHTIFGLLSAGARTITAAHHSPKAFAKEEYMGLENVLRGSGDLGAAISTAWGLRQIDAQKNRIYVQNIKRRDFEPCESFILEGRPHLDQTGQFAMTDPPGFAGELKTHLGKRGGAPIKPENEEKRRQVMAMRADGKSLREIEVETGIPKSTVERWVKETVPELSQNGTLFGTPEESGTGRTPH